MLYLTKDFLVHCHTHQDHMQKRWRCRVTYTPYATSSKEQTGDIITFTQFEEGTLLTETRNNTESGDESDSKSITTSEKDMEKISMKKKSSMTTL